MKGNQVAPAELEALLLEHADVQDAAVIGVKRWASLESLCSVTNTVAVAKTNVHSHTL